MATFSYFLHPPREDFSETMTEVEQQTWAQHFAWIKEAYATGAVILVGVTLGRVNTGVVILEAADENAAREILAADPVTQAGLAEGDLRPFRLSLMRGTPIPS
jgi:uncharacterized protein YciI